MAWDKLLRNVTELLPTEKNMLHGTLGSAENKPHRFVRWNAGHGQITRPVRDDYCRSDLDQLVRLPRSLYPVRRKVCRYDEESNLITELGSLYVKNALPRGGAYDGT